MTLRRLVCASLVAADFRGYANGYPVFDASDGNGREQFKKNIEYWRITAPDLTVDLYDELAEKGKDKTENVAKDTFRLGFRSVTFRWPTMRASLGRKDAKWTAQHSNRKSRGLRSG